MRSYLVIGLGILLTLGLLWLPRPAKQGEVVGAELSGENVLYAYLYGAMNQSVPITTRHQAQKENLSLNREVKRTAYARIFSTSKKGTYIADIADDRPQYYEDESGKWWQLSYAIATPEHYALLPRVSHPIPIAIAATATFNPQSPATTAGDCQLGVDKTATTWAATRATASADAVGNPAGADWIVESRNQAGGGTEFLIYRGVFNFDTSTLGAGSTVTAATLSFSGTGNSTVNTDSTNVSIVSAAPASKVTCVTSDFNVTNFGTGTVYATIALASWNATNNTYNDFVLNSSGFGHISVTSVTTYGTMSGLDVSNTSPTNGNRAFTYWATHTGGASIPKLVVTYTPAAAGASFGLWQFFTF